MFASFGEHCVNLIDNRDATLCTLYHLIFKRNKVHQKDNIFRILWYSDWLHNTTSAGNSIFVTNPNTTSCGRSIMQPIRIPENMRNDIWRFTF